MNAMDQSLYLNSLQISHSKSRKVNCQSLTSNLCPLQLSIYLDNETEMNTVTLKIQRKLLH